jgi:hypothetical protein
LQALPSRDEDHRYHQLQVVWQAARVCYRILSDLRLRKGTRISSGSNDDKPRVLLKIATCAPRYFLMTVDLIEWV